MKFEARPNLRWTVELFAHTRPACSRVQKLNVASGNLDILLGIGRLGSISWKYDIVMGYCRKKKRIFTILMTRMSPEKSGGSSKFPGGLKVTYSVVQNICIFGFIKYNTKIFNFTDISQCKHYKIRKLNINI